MSIKIDGLRMVPRFSGTTDASSFEAWEQRLRAILSLVFDGVDTIELFTKLDAGEALADATDKLFYQLLNLVLDGAAAVHAATTTSGAAVWQNLKGAYATDKSVLRERALDRIEKLTLRGSTLVATQKFIAAVHEQRALFAAAGGKLDEHDSTIIRTLLRRFPPAFHPFVLSHKRTTDMADFCKQLLEFAERQSLLSTRADEAVSSVPQESDETSGATAMFAGSAQVRQRKRGGGGGASQSGSAKGKTKKLCYICASPDHLAHQCPQRDPRTFSRDPHRHGGVEVYWRCR